MEVTNQTVLNVAKQRIHELEDELLTYRIMCNKQAIEIKSKQIIIDELIEADGKKETAKKESKK